MAERLERTPHKHNKHNNVKKNNKQRIKTLLSLIPNETASKKIKELKCINQTKETIKNSC
jgi:hypothetical protein